MRNEFKENIKQEELKEIIFKFSDGQEAKFRPTGYRTWVQYGDVLLDPDLLDELMKVLHTDLFVRENKENE